MNIILTSIIIKTPAIHDEQGSVVTEPTYYLHPETEQPAYHVDSTHPIPNAGEYQADPSPAFHTIAGWDDMHYYRFKDAVEAEQVLGDLWPIRGDDYEL